MRVLETVLAAVLGAVVGGSIVHLRAEDRIEAVRRAERAKAVHPASTARERSLASAYAAGRQRERELARVVPFRLPDEPHSAN